MSGNSSGRGCRSPSHWARRWEIYESLPSPVRDALKIACSNLCAGCIRNTLRRNRLAMTLFGLRVNRDSYREGRGRNERIIPLEPLRDPWEAGIVANARKVENEASRVEAESLNRLRAARAARPAAAPKRAEQLTLFGAKP